MSPFVIASSGRPYNITIGGNVDGDTVFTDRPGFAGDPSEPGVVDTAWGPLDPTPAPGEAIVPRNLGAAPGFFGSTAASARASVCGPRDRALLSRVVLEARATAARVVALRPAEDRAGSAAGPAATGTAGSVAAVERNKAPP